MIEYRIYYTGDQRKDVDGYIQERISKWKKGEGSGDAKGIESLIRIADLEMKTHTTKELISIMEDKNESWAVRIAVIKMLGEKGDKAAIPAIKKMKEPKPGWMDYWDNIDFGDAQIRALEKLGVED